MPLSFQPACLPVAQGGVPHRNPTQALNCIRKTTPALVTCPQLPQRGFQDKTYVQSGTGFPGLILDKEGERIYVDRQLAEREIDHLSLAYLQDTVSYAALSPERMPAFAELRRTLFHDFSGLALQGHIQGPVSLGLQITDESHRPLIYDPMLREELAHYLALRAAWLATQLGELHSEVIVCLDEPFLDAFDLPAFPLDWEDGAELLELVFSAIRGCRGLMTSGAVNWSRVLATSVELVHFDAYRQGHTLLEASDLLRNFLERSGVLTWGLVPADADDLGGETVTTLLVRFEQLLDQLVTAGLSRDCLLESALISTTDSLEHLPVQVAEYALELCAELSTLIRDTFNLT